MCIIKIDTHAQEYRTIGPITFEYDPYNDDKVLQFVDLNNTKRYTRISSRAVIGISIQEPKKPTT